MKIKKSIFQSVWLEINEKNYDDILNNFLRSPKCCPISTKSLSTTLNKKLKKQKLN